MRAPGMTPTAIRTAKRQSMSPRKAWVIIPGTAKMPTQTSDVAIVCLSRRPTNWLKPGTIRTPPPIPRSPDSIPATAPTAPTAAADR